MKWITEMIINNKLKKKAEKALIMKEGNIELVNEYNTKYKNKKVILSNGLSGKVINYKIYEKYFEVMSTKEYYGLIDFLYIKINDIIYEVNIDNVIGIQNTKKDMLK